MLEPKFGFRIPNRPSRILALCSRPIGADYWWILISICVCVNMCMSSYIFPKSVWQYFIIIYLNAMKKALWLEAETQLARALFGLGLWTGGPTIYLFQVNHFRGGPTFTLFECGTQNRLLMVLDTCILHHTNKILALKRSILGQANEPLGLKF